MMIGPMKKKVITSSVVTAVILILVFAVVSYLFLSSNSKRIAELERKSEVVQRYVFTNDLAAGTIITPDDIKVVEVKGESAPDDSFEYNPDTKVDEKNDIIGRRLKVNALKQTIVTESLFYDLDEKSELDTRLQEYNMISLPSDLVDGDYIDVRIRFATGEDYSVIVGKKVESVGALEEQSNTVFLRLNEEEIVRMSCAIIESYINKGVLLYANKYVDPSNQLYDYKYVDLVSKYKALKTEIIESEVSGEEDTTIERDDKEIATILGVPLADIENVAKAIENKDKDTIALYNNKLIKTEKSISTTYPVKPVVATLIKNNPNILADIKAKYNVEALMAQRQDFMNTDLTKMDEMTGQLVDHEEHLTNIQEKLDKEIETQRTERQEYLLNLLGKTTVTEEE